MSDDNVTVNGKVQSLLAEVFQVPEEAIPQDLAFGDLPQWDSLGHMELMVALEDRFGVEIDAEVIGELTSVDAIRRFLQARMRGEASHA